MTEPAKRVLANAKSRPEVRALRKWHGRLREPMLTLLLAIQIMSLFVMPGMRSVGFSPPRIVTIAVLLVFVGLAAILSRSRAAKVMLVASVALTIAGGVWRSEHANLLTNAVSTMGQVLTQLSLLWVVASAVFGPGRTTYHRILGGIVMYLGIGMLFTSLDILLAQSISGAFTHIPDDSFGQRETLTYFSFSTLTTGSFGDIIPVHPIARNLANMESICGQLFPATLLARIVGLHASSRDE